MGYADLEAAHIIPFSIGAAPEVRYLAYLPDISLMRLYSQMWVAIQRFGGILQEELNGKMINREENVMTLCQDVHSDFGAMRIWLEPQVRC